MEMERTRSQKKVVPVSVLGQPDFSLLKKYYP